MSMFFCHQCDDLCDADDGCDEDPNNPHELICVECMEANEADIEDLIYAHNLETTHGTI
jgi:hypothetical protein